MDITPGSGVLAIEVLIGNYVLPVTILGAFADLPSALKHLNWYVNEANPKGKPKIVAFSWRIGVDTPHNINSN